MQQRPKQQHSARWISMRQVQGVECTFLPSKFQPTYVQTLLEQSYLERKDDGTFPTSTTALVLQYNKLLGTSYVQQQQLLFSSADLFSLLFFNNYPCTSQRAFEQNFSFFMTMTLAACTNYNFTNQEVDATFALTPVPLFFFFHLPDYFRTARSSL